MSDLENNPSPYIKDDDDLSSDDIRRTASGRSINEPKRITYVQH